MVKIAVHYATTFAVGAIATWIFQWTAVEWLVYFVVYFERNEGQSFWRRWRR